MLAGSTPYPCAALGNPVDFTGPFLNSPFLIIVFHISEGRLVRQRADGAGPESMPLAKDHFCIGVGITLVFP